MNGLRSILLLLVGLLPLLLQAEGGAEQPTMRTVTEQFQDWAISCVEQQDATVCEVRHSIVTPEGGIQGQLSVSGRSDKPGELLFQVALPLLADLKRTVAIQIDEEAQTHMQYAFCTPAACFVAEPLNDELVALFKKGMAFTIYSRNLRHGDVVLKGSLLGFSAALNRLKKKVEVK